MQLQLFLYLIFLNIYFATHNFLVAAVSHCILEIKEVLAYKATRPHEVRIQSPHRIVCAILDESLLSLSTWIDHLQNADNSISFCLSFFYIGLQTSWGSNCFPHVIQHPANGTLNLIWVLHVTESLFLLINTKYNTTFLFSSSVFWNIFITYAIWEHSCKENSVCPVLGVHQLLAPLPGPEEVIMWTGKQSFLKSFCKTGYCPGLEESSSWRGADTGVSD